MPYNQLSALGNFNPINRNGDVTLNLLHFLMCFRSDHWKVMVLHWNAMPFVNNRCLVYLVVVGQIPLIHHEFNKVILTEVQQYLN